MPNKIFSHPWTRLMVSASSWLLKHEDRVDTTNKEGTSNCLHKNCHVP